MKKIIIAVDGYSSTGKSTLAKQLAQKLGYIYVDTGAMYRAVTLFALQNHLVGKDFLNREQLIAELNDIQLNFKFNPDLGYAEMYLQHENVERQIRGMEVSELVSRVAEIPEVRQALVKQQQAMGKDKGLVMDGRDIGTVVFPEAELKIFMTADPQIRAERRFHELKEKGSHATFEEVLTNVKYRDALDTTRKDSPLKMASDAVEVDNSNLSINEQFQLILDLAKERIEEP